MLLKGLNYYQSLKIFMCPITIRRIFGLLASTEISSFIFFYRKCHRRKGSTLMCSVAERLGRTFATSTPIISFTLFKIYGDGGFLSDYRFIHYSISFFNLPIIWNQFFEREKAPFDLYRKKSLIILIVMRPMLYCFPHNFRNRFRPLLRFEPLQRNSPHS